MRQPEPWEAVDGLTIVGKLGPKKVFSDAKMKFKNF